MFKLYLIKCAVPETPWLTLPTVSHTDTWAVLTPPVPCYSNLCQFLSLLFSLNPSSCPFPFFFLSRPNVHLSLRTLLLSTVVAVTVTPAPPTVPPSYRCTLLALLPRCCLHILISSCPISIFSHFTLFAVFLFCFVFYFHCPKKVP